MTSVDNRAEKNRIFDTDFLFYRSQIKDRQVGELKENKRIRRLLEETSPPRKTKKPVTSIEG